MSAATTANFEFGLTTSHSFSVASESIRNGFIADSMSANLFNLQPADVCALGDPGAVI